jgi:hypothetical protein
MMDQNLVKALLFIGFNISLWCVIATICIENQEKIENFLDLSYVYIKLYFIILSFSLAWVFRFGNAYYIITYRFPKEEEGVFHTIEFPPIWWK